MPQISARRECWHRQDRTKTCISCGEEKPLAEFYAYAYTTRQGKRSTRYESRCKPCARARRSRQYAADRPAELKRMKAWRDNNADHVRDCQRSYRATESGKRTRARLQRLRKARMRASLAGPEDRKEIRSVYAEAMELQELFGVKIHVDHVVPLSKGGKHEAGNLQILLAKANMKKGAKLPSHASHEIRGDA